MNTPDKYIWTKKEGLEYRTFCTCRNGEIWNVPCENISTLSGRADGIKSQYSNFGFLVRYEGNSFNRGLAIWKELQSYLGKGKVTVELLEEFLTGSNIVKDNSSLHTSWLPEGDYFYSPIENVLGKTLTADLKDGLSHLVKEYPDFIDYETYCLFPAIEGFGYYPNINNELLLRNENIWFTGDVVGNFRGIVPAFISGYVAGLSITSQIAY